MNSWILLFASLAMMLVGAEFLIRGVSGFAKRSGWSEFVVAVLILGVGGALPELIISIATGISGQDGIAVGNVISSNIINILLLLGVAAMIRPISIPFAKYRSDMWFLGISTIMFSVMIWMGGISRIGGILLLGMLVGFLVNEYFTDRNKRVKQSAEYKKREARKYSWSKIILGCAAGLAILSFGSHEFMNALDNLVGHIGIPETVLGALIIAPATSSPELLITVVAMFHRQVGIVFGNLLGSTLMHIVLVIGATATCRALEVSKEFQMFDVWFMIGSFVLLMFNMKRYNKVSRPVGLLFVILYAIYIIGRLWLF